MKKILVILLLMSGFVFSGTMTNIDIFTGFDISVCPAYCYDEASNPNPQDNDYLVVDNIDTWVYLSVDSLASTSIDFTIQCATKDMIFQQIYTRNFLAMEAIVVPVGERCYALAVGARCNGCAAFDNITVKLETYK